MRPKTQKSPESVVREIKRRTRRKFKSEEKIRIILEDLGITRTGLDLLTLSNEYLKDAEASCLGHDTFALKKRFCREVLEKWGNVRVKDITVHMVQSYLLERAKKVSNNSFNVYRQEGRRLFGWAKKQQLLPSHHINPFEKVEKKRHERGKPRPAAVEHVVKAYIAATPDQKDLILTYLVTGARKNEILSWQWSDVDFANRIYALHTRKTGTGELKTTHHEMPDLLHKILLRRFEKRHPVLPCVFWYTYWDRKKGEWRDDRYQSLNKFTKRLCKKAKVPPFHLHQLRHLAASVLKDRGGMSLAKLQRFLRHDKQKTTEIYAGHLETGTKEQNDFLAEFWTATLGARQESDGGGA